MLKKIINACGCIDIKIVVLLFFVLAIIFSMYGSICMKSKDKYYESIGNGQIIELLTTIL